MRYESICVYSLVKTLDHNKMTLKFMLKIMTDVYYTTLSKTGQDLLQQAPNLNSKAKMSN